MVLSIQQESRTRNFLSGRLSIHWLKYVTSSHASPSMSMMPVMVPVEEVSMAPGGLQVEARNKIDTRSKVDKVMANFMAGK
jgi:hypothetical protein